MLENKPKQNPSLPKLFPKFALTLSKLIQDSFFIFLNTYRLSKRNRAVKDQEKNIVLDFFIEINQYFFPLTALGLFDKLHQRKTPLPKKGVLCLECLG